MTGAARLLAFALLGLVAGCGPDAPTPRTVLLISIDTARADSVRFDDPETTPHLSELAERGVVFEQAVTGTSWTLPSHVQMFTGQPPALHGVNFDDVRIDPRTPLLAELFSEAGWFTAGYYSGWYLVKDYGFQRGFAIYENAMPGGSRFERELRDASRIENEVQRGEALAAIWARADQVSHRAISSPVVLEKALDAISQADGRDLFLFLHFFDPHYDYVPPGDIARRFDPDYTGSIDGSNFYSNPLIVDRDGRRVISDRDLEHIRALYRGEIHWTDQHIGEVLAALDDAGRLDSSFVAVVGDHGEEFFEHDGRGHRNTLYDEQLRVPMLIVPPRDGGFDVGRSVATQTSLSDVAPTLLDYAGLERDHCYGISLVPALAGDALPARDQYSNLRAFPRVPTGDRSRVTHIYSDAWRRPDLKLLRGWMYEAHTGHFKFSDWVLYDLANDPLEQRPIRNVDDPRFVEAWNAAEALKADLREAHAARPFAPAAERISTAADMLADVLGQLGYREDGSAGGSDVGPEASYEVPWELAPPPALTLDALRAQIEKR